MNDPESENFQDTPINGPNPSADLAWVPPPRLRLTASVRLVRVVAAVLLAILMLVLLVLIAVFVPFGMLIVMQIIITQAWCLYAFLHYRLERRNEVVQLLASATDAHSPLEVVLRAYLRERPVEGWRYLWALAGGVVAAPIYLWIWLLGLSFDRKVRRLATLLQEGAPLSEALDLVPGVVPRSAVLGAAVGESTGKLGESLRASACLQVGPIWLEAMPRLFYPAVLFLIVLFIAEFWSLYLFPKMEKIYKDFGLPLPTVTRWAGEFLRWLENLFPVLTLLPLAAVTGTCVLIFNPSTRYYIPLLGHLYNLSMQSRLATMLSLLLGAGKPAPEALDLITEQLANDEVFCNLLRRARSDIQAGEALVDSLDRNRLVPASAVPLLHSAQRMNNLPWALSELGRQLATRTETRSHRLSLLLSPILVLAIGAVVGFLVLSLFLPLVHILSEMSQQ
jgi:type IV pilus assembly protein PilC